MTKVIDITQFNSYIAKNGDMAAAIYKAVNECSDGDKVLVFPKDIYHVYYKKCYEEYLFISNHDHSLKKIAFSLKHIDNLTIDGNGSEFIFHGRVTPFAIDKSKNITIRNLSIDYARPFFTEGEVIQADKEQVTLKIDSEKYPFHIKDDRIYFHSNDEWENTYIKWFIEFDPKRKAPTYAMLGSDLRAQNVKAELVEKDIVKFSASFYEKHTVGHIINITHEQRYNPGILINESENIILENINIYHTGAMGVIGQNSKNISLNNVKVTTREGSNRMISTNNDATHFVNCEGLIKIENCTFQHQLDDGTNIHGIYNVVSNIYSDEEIELELMHFQQHGINIYRKGDRIAIVDKETHMNKGYAVVKDVKQINQKFISLRINLEEGSKIEEQDCISNYKRMPEVIIKNCNYGDNRARGILISTNKKTLIENNNFYTSGSAICCGGEMHDWFECGPVKELTIKNNRFNNCGYAKWGIATISVNIKLDKIHKNEYVNSNFRIIENEFNTFEPPILYTISVDGVEFSNNKICHTKAFKPFKDREFYLELQASNNITISKNAFEDIEENKLVTSEMNSKIKTISQNKFIFTELEYD